MTPMEELLKETIEKNERRMAIVNELLQDLVTLTDFMVGEMDEEAEARRWYGGNKCACDVKGKQTDG